MATKIEEFLRGFLSILSVLTCLLLPSVSHAHSAVAWVQGHSVSTIYAGWNFPTQKAADATALDGCRKAATESGLSKVASKCQVQHRQEHPGGGAIVCGINECSMHTGSDTEQGAVDRAYQHCVQNYVECQKTEIRSWWDDAGYPKQVAKKEASAKTCGPPPGRTVRSTYQCNNGDCTRTFENGCKVRFQAPYCHDPATGKWEWKADGC
ncbi:hypothetical protein [Massilia sp. TWR1-2-2]|uniref:hypothetical protein n=1 Tax=Massilia sp. TWR1-2-2 TaxID=2804584 RepID=UPI003CEB396E